MFTCTKLRIEKLLLLLLLLSVGVIKAKRVKRGRCSSRSLAISNGTYQLRSRNSCVVYACNKGYSLFGYSKRYCIGTRWSPDPPKCINMGNLQVYFKPFDADLNNMKSHFCVNKNKGLDWQFGNLTIPAFNKPFQIVFVATRATSHKSDFALDDFNLVSDCLWKSRHTTTTTSTSISTSTTSPTTATTTKASTTRSTSTSTTAPTTSTTSKASTTTSTSTPASSTPIPMTNATNSPNSTTIGSSNSTFVDQPRTTLKPIVHPHDKDERVASASSQSFLLLLLFYNKLPVDDIRVTHQITRSTQFARMKINLDIFLDDYE